MLVINILMHAFSSPSSVYGLDPHPARVQRGVYKLCMYLKLHGIKPIFVFDGPGRIIEKQRETRRREALKEKVERSFQFEKERKTRLRGLRGSAQLLQTYSPDKISSILDDIRLQGDAATVLGASASQSPSDGNSLAKHEVGSSAPVRETVRKPSVWDFLDARILSDSDEASNHDDQAWIAPAAIEENGQADLDAHLQLWSRYYEAGAPLLDAGVVDESLEMDLFERELDTLDRLELDLETVDGLDIIQDLTDKDIGLLSNEIPQILRTGTSVTAIIPPSDMMQIAKEDPSGPDFDVMVREKVHAALEKYVQHVESRAQGNPELAAEITTQRQRDLNALEQKLVQEIKETSRVNALKHASRTPPALDGSQPARGHSLSGSKDREMEPDLMPAIVTSTTTTTAPQETPEERDSTAKEENADFSSTPELNQDGYAVDTAEPAGTFETTVAVDIAGLVDTASTVDDADTVDTVNAMGAADAVGTDDVMPAASDDTRTGNKGETMVERSAIENEEQDMRSMIHNVLSAHQSIFTSLERRTLRVTRSLVLSCQYLLQAMGEHIIEAYDAEAESVCAHLTTLGVADASVSEDTDTAVFGNGLLLRQVAVGGEKDILEIDPLIAHSALGMNRDAFRDFCILCGTDFSGVRESPSRFFQLFTSVHLR